MENEYLEMHGKELLINGVVVAEVTHIEDAIAISDQVSNYVKSLERKIEEFSQALGRLQQTTDKLERELNLFKQGENLSPYSHEGMSFCEVTGQPKSDCSCPDCWPEGHDEPSHDY